MVIGGYGGNALDSTEILSDNAWRIVTGKLPLGMYSMSAVNINNRIQTYGNWYLLMIEIESFKLNNLSLKGRTDRRTQISIS